MKSLFGEEISDKPPEKVKGHFKQWRAINKYCKSKTEERCGNCVNLIPAGHNDRMYYKCALQGISSCVSSDIRLSYVCKNYQPDFKTTKEEEV